MRRLTLNPQETRGAVLVWIAVAVLVLIDGVLSLASLPYLVFLVLSWPTAMAVIGVRAKRHTSEHAKRMD